MIRIAIGFVLSCRYYQASVRPSDGSTRRDDEIRSKKRMN
jgi:hypothetical protein